MVGLVVSILSVDPIYLQNVGMNLAIPSSVIAERLQYLRERMMNGE